MLTNSLSDKQAKKESWIKFKLNVLENWEVSPQLCVKRKSLKVKTHKKKYQIYWKYKYHKTLTEWAKSLTLPTSNYPKGSTCFNNMHFIVKKCGKNEEWEIPKQNKQIFKSL